LSVQYIICTIT